MKILLNNKFYKEEAIEKAIGCFKEAGGFKILNDSFEIEVTPKTGDEKLISMEFCNFVLGVMKDNNLF